MSSKELVSDELWQIVEPLLPTEPPNARGGRPRIPERAVLSGIILRPQERHSLADAASGDGLRQRRNLLETAPGLAQGGRMASSAPSTSGPAGKERQGRLVEGELGLGERTRQKGGEAVGPNPTDRGKPGSKHHLLSDSNGVPLAVVLTAFRTSTTKVFEELVDAMEVIKHPPDRPRKRPEKLHADKAYDAKKCQKALRKRGIKSRIARKGKETSERLGRHRWLSRYRRLLVRYERRADIHEALLRLGCSLVLSQLPVVRRFSQCLLLMGRCD